VRTGVLGLGLIGGSLLKGLAAAGEEPLGADADPHVAGAARAGGFGVVPDAAALARECDVVIACIPPGSAGRAAAELLAADPDVVVADAASVKGSVMRDVAAHAGAAAMARFVGAHPLAGSAAAGWDASDVRLLRDALWAVCPPAPDAPAEPLCALAAALDPLAARLLVCDADEHDAAVARTSHVPHVAAQALARLPSDPLGGALSGGAYRDMTRTAASDPELWLGIVAANRAAVAGGLRALLEDLAGLAAAVEEGRTDVLAAAWHEGAAARVKVDAIRWSEPAWEPRRLAWPAWDALLELGRAGVVVRRPAREGDELVLDAAAPA
jgi:prephenate dehydrogenase